MMKNCPYWYVSILFVLFSCSKEGPLLVEEDAPRADAVEQISASTLRFPKKEIRGAWIATVWGLDGPESDYNPESQKRKYVALLNKLADLHINAIFVQVMTLIKI